MVMRCSMMRRNLRRSIYKSLGRYVAIAMIIALGAGIFVGLRSTKMDMVATGQAYTDQQNMFDLRLLSTYGWDRSQLEPVSQLPGVEQAEGVFYSDLIGPTVFATGRRPLAGRCSFRRTMTTPPWTS